MRKRQPMVVLASTSPRRIELLKAVGLKISLRAPQVDESVRPGEKPKALVGRLARVKAASCIVPRDRNYCIVIAADTIVVSPDGKKILNKPVDRKDAARMLGLLAGRNHTVHTGYCVIAVQGGRVLREISRVVTSKVGIRPLSRADIANYIATDEPMDKAGSYAAQGQGMLLVEKIQGSYTNVVGLPLCQLARDLEEIFGLSLFRWTGP